MILSYLKNIVLSILVIMSVVFSVLLYRGGWGDYTEAGLTDSHVLTITSYPQVQESAAPYQISIKSPKSVTVAVPGGPNYNELLDKLNAMSIYDLRKPVTTKESSLSISFDFGSVLTHDELVKFIPSLQTSATALAVRQVVIFLDPVSKKVRCCLKSNTQSFLATTDVDEDTFRTWIDIGKSLPQQVEWGRGTEQYVPKNDIQMASSDWTLSTSPLLPLIHSFFVNPQAATRIQTGPSTAIWTDGNRAVRVDTGSSILTYENPNTSMEPASNLASVTLTLGYIRDHGGSSKASLLYQLGANSLGDDSSIYALHMIYEGFPILSQVGTYEVTTSKGRVVEFRRPQQELKEELSRTNVTALGYERLMTLVRKLSPRLSPDSMSVQLGYQAVPVDRSIIRLKPIYTISHQGIVVWTIDAVTGQVTQGMDVK